eukprot:scaffold42103_cov61-Phaeocystis_antarctica.AAC.2
MRSICSSGDATATAWHRPRGTAPAGTTASHTIVSSRSRWRSLRKGRAPDALNCLLPPPSLCRSFFAQPNTMSQASPTRSEAWQKRGEGGEPLACTVLQRDGSRVCAPGLRDGSVARHSRFVTGSSAACPRPRRCPPKTNMAASAVPPPSKPSGAPLAHPHPRSPALPPALPPSAPLDRRFAQPHRNHARGEPGSPAETHPAGRRCLPPSRKVAR